MRKREWLLTLLAAAGVVLALLAVFAIELSNTQAKSKQDVKARVNERAVLAAALIESLFQSGQQQLPQQARRYGTPVVSQSTLNQNRQESAYLALLDPSGSVIASSDGFTSQARADLRISSALRLLRQGKPYALGDVLPYGKTGVLNYAIKIPTQLGTRTLLNGLTPGALSFFLAGELSRIPGVKGAYNYILDGRGRVLASTNPAQPPGVILSDAARIFGQPSGTIGGHYYDQVPLANSTWHIVLSAPQGPLFASVTGLRKWVPWMIFAAFAMVALTAIVLARRLLASAEQVRTSNAQLEHVNGELALANNALERRAEELARSNSELEQFASVASHDLQEPLRKVRTFTQQVATVDGDRLTHEGHDYLERSNHAAARMQQLIEDLLRFSRVGTHRGPFVPVDLNELTREVLDDLHAEIERASASVKVKALPTVDGDALQLRQLMQNLISNAIKFHRPAVPPEVTISAEVLGDRVHLAVTDGGIGFESQYSRRIFRVFERLHGRSEYPGTGIGLALCAKIAERHGGGILAESQPGAGATFRVILPLKQRNSSAPPAPSTAARVNASRGIPGARENEPAQVAARV